MIFIAKGMNASANNLGKLDFKSVDDISQETKDLLAFYGADYTDSQKLAVDDFLTSFNSASWKDKVLRLVLPFLAPDDENSYVINPYGAVKMKALYDVVSKEELGMYSSNGNNAKVKLVDGGIAYEGDTSSINPCGLIPKGTEYDETCVGGFYNSSKTQGWGDIGLGNSTYLRDKIGQCYCTVGQVNNLIFVAESDYALRVVNLSRANNVFSYIRNGAVVSSNSFINFTNGDISVVKMVFSKEHPTKLAFEAKGMSNEDACEFSVMLMKLMEDFGA